MKYRFVKILSFILILTLSASFFRFYNLPFYVSAQTATSSLSLTWNNPPGTLTGNAIDYTPQTNALMVLPMKLTFSLGNISNVKAGDVKIRIPKSIFRGRDGKLVGECSLPLPKQPNISEITSFNYYVDDETDEIVITNFEPILNTLLFKLDIEYKCYPTEIKDGYTNDSIMAKAKIETENEAPLTLQSEKISACIHTWAKIDSLIKYDKGSYSEWNFNLGTKPENSEQYFYQIWGIKEQCSYTQPYTLKIIENMGDDFEFVGWKKTDEPDNPPYGQFKMGTYEDFTEENFSSCWIIFRRKKPAANQKISYTNTATVTLSGIDGAADSKQASASGEFTSEQTEDPDEYEYPGDSQYISKEAFPREYTESNAGINILEKGLPIYPYYSIHYGATVWDMVNSESGETGKKYCTVEVEDSYFVLNEENLLPQDYYINSFLLESEFFKQWISEKKLKSEVAQTPPMEIYIRSTLSEDWKLLYTVVSNSDNTFTFTDDKGSSETKDECSHELPLEAKFIKAQFKTNLQKYDITLSISVTLFPTENILSGIAGLNNANFSNRAKSTVTDDKNNKLIKSSDANLILTRQTAGGSAVKNCTRLDSNPSIGVENFNYEVLFLSDMQYNTQYVSTENMLDSKMFEPLQKGVIYDLLPAGVSIYPESISFQKGISDSQYAEISKNNYKVYFIDNWRNSGQTMLKIEFDLDGLNYYDSPYYSLSHIHSNLRLSFNISNPWYNIIDNGSTVKNRVACYAEKGKLYGEIYPDDPSVKYPGDSIWNYFKDLNEDGNVSDNEVVQYAENTSEQSALFAAQYGFTKKVKSLSDKTFSQETNVNAVGRYIYQLRFMTEEKASASGIIMYDVLENYYYSDRYWKGYFDYIDVSHPISKGIKPVIYYSVNRNINPYSNSSHADLSNTEIWSTQIPEDISTVKAIAVDLRTKSDGSRFVLEPEESLYCNIGMIAPGDYGDNSTKDSKAYNGGIIQANITNTATSSTNPITELCVPTSVNLIEPSVKIKKKSNPETGTKASPSYLKPDGKLTYTLSVINTSNIETFRKIIVEDTIPNQLTIDTANIKYYFGNNSSTAKPLNKTGDIRFELVSGNKLIFNISELGINETINFIIPTTAFTHSELIENTSFITSINDIATLVQSETTYHILMPYYRLPESGGVFNMNQLYLLGTVFVLCGLGLSVFMVCKLYKKHKS